MTLHSLIFVVDHVEPFVTIDSDGVMSLFSNLIPRRVEACVECSLESLVPLWCCCSECAAFTAFAILIVNYWYPILR